MNVLLILIWLFSAALFCSGSILVTCFFLLESQNPGRARFARQVFDLATDDSGKKIDPFEVLFSAGFLVLVGLVLMVFLAGYHLGRVSII